MGTGTHTCDCEIGWIKLAPRNGGAARTEIINLHDDSLIKQLIVAKLQDGGCFVGDQQIVAYQKNRGCPVCLRRINWDRIIMKLLRFWGVLSDDEREAACYECGNVEDKHAMHAIDRIETTKRLVCEQCHAVYVRGNG